VERPSNVVNAETLKETEWGEGRCRMRRRDLGRAAGSVDVGLKRIVLYPGYQSYPEHHHSAEEEMIYILRGSGTLTQDGERVLVEAGDTISHPSNTGVPHALVADRGEELEYLAFGERDPDDVVSYPNSGKVMIRALGAPGTPGLVCRMEETDYWEGER
jgi:uncharacterized cupin superfamily protein